MKRICAVALIGALLVLHGSGLAAPAGIRREASGAQTGDEGAVTAGVPQGYTTVAEKGGLSLAIDLETANIVVRDEAAGSDWYTSPPGVLEDESMSAHMAEQLASSLLVSFIDSTLNEVTVNSYDGSVKESAYEVRQIKDGLKITYDFSAESMQFRIPVQVTLGEEYAQAEILYDEIEEYGAARITNIDLFPSFGAGKVGEDGYLFLPSGSGALVDYADSESSSASYRQMVYGENPAVGLLLKTKPEQGAIRLPVFGAKNGDAAFLAVLHAGEAAGSIYARGSAGDSPYFAAGAGFVYHQKDLTGIRDKEANYRTVVMVEDKPVDVNPVVRYYFLRDEDADYSGMARCYRAYLIQRYGLKPKAQEGRHVALEFFGTTRRKTTFLGIPITRTVNATTFGQTQSILDALREKGAGEADVLLYGFEKGGFENRYPFSAALDGGEQGYTALRESAPDSRFYLAFDLVRDYGGGFRLFSHNTYARSLNKVAVVRREPLRSTGDWNTDAPSWKYVSAASLLEKLPDFLKGVPSGNNTGLLLRRFGEELGSDFNPEAPTDRTQMQEVYRRAADQAGKSVGQLAAEGGNAYLLDSASLLTEIPSSNNGHDLFTETVPFYSMVLHGYVSLTSTPVNDAGSPADFLLTLLETGIRPTYRLTGCDPADLAETPLNYLVNTKADNWLDDIAAASACYGEIQKGLGDVPIRSHAYEGPCSVVTYENGVVLIANHTGVDADCRGRTIPAGQILRVDP